MALRDITNTNNGSYIPQVKLNSRYAPVIKRGVLLENQDSRANFATRRAAGETHIDLWIDGGLYPMDPATNSPPCFNTTKTYLEFLCHGDGGMLGYTKRLSGAGMNGTLMDLQSTIQVYEEDIRRLQEECEVQRGIVESMSQSTTELVQERNRLQSEVGNLEATCEELRMSLAVATQRSQETMNSLEADLSRCKASYEKLQVDVQYMVETPRGLRKRVHIGSMKNVDELAPGFEH